MSERDRHSDETADGRSAGAPRAVAGFRLLRKIGEGGMSAVFQSYDVTAARPVAVKILADHLAGQPEFVGRFYREARLSRILEHPHIVQGYASGFDPDVDKHYLVLELIDGPTAHGALALLGRLSVGMVVRIGIDIARALEFLHARQYVHRDVKPDNILLHPDVGPKLADLGVAKRLNDDSQLTAIHQGVGTSYYMPYEQAVNANLVDGRSDIFALGSTLYHLLTGEVPFLGGTHDEIIREKWAGTFRPIRDANPTVPPAVAALVEATLACDPRARVQKAAHLARALAATKLATRLPSFAFAGGSHLDAPGEDRLTSDDTPTRTDHRIVPGPPIVPPSGGIVPAGPSLTPPGDDAFVGGLTSSAGTGREVGSTQTVPPAPGTAPETARSPRGWRWFIGTGTVLLALLAQQLYRARPMSDHANPSRVTVPRDTPAAPADHRSGKT